jgi:signal transduction histidine kinase
MINMGGAARRWYGDVRHLAIGGLIGLACPVLWTLTLAAAALSLVGVGLPALVWAVQLTRRLADVQRRRFREQVPSPYPPMPSTLRGKLRTIVRTSATWRDLVWLALPAQLGFALIVLALCSEGLEALVMPLLWLGLPPEEMSFNGIAVPDLRTALMFVPVGVGLLLLALPTPRALVGLDARLTGWLLAPTAAARLTARVERLTETRSEALDASAVELRRIERDLHDGAQARLVALAMNLGMAEDMFDSDPEAARAMLADARAGAHTAMTELRDLVRGMHPPLLADRGVGGALQALAMGSPVAVDLDVRLDRRLAPPVESAAYFTIVEGMTNAVKHSGAARITLAVTDLGDRLRLRVTDDGRGGADPARGTGLRGIERRLAAFDGSLRVTSPVGGPTVIEAELPCAS